MTSIFISYSRQDKAIARKLVVALQQVYGHNNVWWDENFYGGQVWWEEIRQQIAACDVFIYLLSPRSLNSPYCLAEFEEARRIHKSILPVKIRRETRVPTSLAKYHYLDLSTDKMRSNQLILIRSINELAKYSRLTLPPITLTPVDMPQTLPQERHNLIAQYLPQIFMGIFVTVVGGVILAVIIQADRFAPSTPTQTPAATVSVPASTIPPTITLLPPSDTPPVPTNAPAPTEIPDIDTPDAPQALINPNPSNGINVRNGPGSNFAAIGSLATNTTTEILGLNNSGEWLKIRYNTGEGWISRSFTTVQGDISGLPREAGPTIPQPLEQITFFTRNDDWIPVERDFDGVTMVQVPVGCFTIGANPQFEDEYNGNEVCFYEPFWIDKTEVTHAEFTRLGGVQANSPAFEGDNRPVERITWFEARDFCALRGGRLPTEAEWEYAARGPDELVYPWGNEFVAENVVYGENSNSQTAEVSSRPGGGSWVGALNMGGNVQEWTNSLYEAYPYNAYDGREGDAGSRIEGRRVARGGSWSYIGGHLHASGRAGLNPDNWTDFIGFRCFRSLNSSEN